MEAIAMRQRLVSLVVMILMSAITFAPTLTLAPAPASAQGKKAKKEKSPFNFQTSTEGVDSLALFINFVAHMGVDWAEKVQGTIDVSGTKVSDKKERALAAGILKRIPTGSKNNFFRFGHHKYDGRDYVRWLDDTYDCRHESTNEYKIAIWSDGCKDAADVMSKVILKAAKDSSANNLVKGNMQYTHDKALEMLKGNKKINGDKAVKADKAIALLHLSALLLPFSEWSNAYGLSDDRNLLVNKKACFLPDGKEAICGKITKADAKGVTIDKKMVTWDDILGDGPALAIGDIDVIKRNWGKGGGAAADGRLQLSLRSINRFGDAPGYEGTPGNFGVMALGRYSLHPNIKLQLGLGIGVLTGQPTLGVDEEDSRLAFMGLAGLRVLVGSTSWWLVPVGEVNLTFQGSRPGAELAFGAELFRTTDFGLSILGTYGFYPTGKDLYTHPDYETEPFTLSGFGGVLEVGWTF